MNLSDGKLGILTFAVLVIAIVGLWKFGIATWASRHPDSGLAQTVVHFW